MKKLILAFMAIGLFTACKKSNSNSSDSYRMTAMISGTAKTFNVSQVASRVTVGGINVVGINGFVSTSTKEGIAISISSKTSGKTIVAGTYSDTTAACVISAVYIQDATTQYIAGNAIALSADFSGITIQNHFTLKITSIDAQSIKGSFSGDVYPNSDVTKTPKTITLGDFYLKIQ